MLGGGSAVVYFIFLALSSASILNSCRDENNKPVDWFAIYKVPKIKHHPNPLIRAGLGYAYISSADERGWVLSNKSINDTTSVPSLTLLPLYDIVSNSVSQEALYVLYNDQPPVGNVSLRGGHTKGVVYADDTGGFWLVHSVPHFPPIPTTKHYSYPKTGRKNGQSFLCVTMSPAQLDLVGTQLMYNDPHIFANSTPAGLKAQYPTLSKAAVGDEIKSPPWYHSEPLVSAAGTSFQSFAKTTKFNKDLYSDWVVVALQVDMLVETWPNGRGRLNSSCHNPYKVENVDGVKMTVVGESFSSKKDHSKWAVSESKDDPWVCIGDINRATTQAIRGGGTVCLRDPLLWQAYYSSVSSVESCPR